MFGHVQSHTTRRGLVARLEAARTSRHSSKDGLSSFTCVELAALHVARSALRAYGSHASRYCSASRQSCDIRSDRSHALTR